MRYHLTLVRKAIIKKSTNKECWRVGEEKETLLHYWWNWKTGVAVMENSMQKNKKVELLYDPVTPLQDREKP